MKEDGGDGLKGKAKEEIKLQRFPLRSDNREDKRGVWRGSGTINLVLGRRRDNAALAVGISRTTQTHVYPCSGGQ